MQEIQLKKTDLKSCYMIILYHFYLASIHKITTKTVTSVSDNSLRNTFSQR